MVVRVNLGKEEYVIFTEPRPQGVQKLNVQNKLLEEDYVSLMELGFQNVLILAAIMEEERMDFVLIIIQLLENVSIAGSIKFLKRGKCVHYVLDIVRILQSSS